MLRARKSEAVILRAAGVLLICGVVICAGCSTTGESVAIANRAATRFLYNFNRSKLAARYGGPFALSEYSRSVSKGVDPSCGKRGVRVDYDLQRKVDFDGQVKSFTVWVWQGERGKVARVSGR